MKLSPAMGACFHFPLVQYSTVTVRRAWRPRWKTQGWFHFWKLADVNPTRQQVTYSAKRRGRRAKPKEAAQRRLRKNGCLLEESHQSKQSKRAGSVFRLQILHSPRYFLLTFSPASFAIRLRSSVVSVLFSLIAEMVPTGPKILDYSTLWRSPETTARLAWRDDGIVSEALHCCLVMQIWRVLALSSLSRFRDLGEGYLEP